jgi:hypothetical protein
MKTWENTRDSPFREIDAQLVSYPAGRADARAGNEARAGLSG